MSLLHWTRKHVLGAMVVAFGVGAAGVVALLGVPRLWSSEAAGWASAIATFGAVVVALWTAQQQIEVAKAAVLEERATAEIIQRNEWEAAANEQRQTAVRLAHAFARELAYAKRFLCTTLLDWDPRSFAGNSRVIMDAFANEKPFNDLTLIRTFSDRLQGFNDEDAFALLTVLTSWQFFNNGPGRSLEEILALPAEEKERMAHERVKFGLQLLDLVDEVINRLARYYQDHPGITGIANADLPERAKEALAEMRGQ